VSDLSDLSDLFPLSARECVKAARLAQFGGAYFGGAAKKV